MVYILYIHSSSISIIAIWYFLFGYKENKHYKCILPDDFDQSSYKYFNEDLANFNEEQLKNHYLMHGRIENRIYKFDLPSDFSCEGYKRLNTDLIHLNEDDLKLHYM